MARLVDADKIVNGIALYMAENAYLNDTPLDALKMVANWIAEAPSVDAVEVVRCRDCKFGMHFGDPEDEWINCRNLHGNPLMPFDAFCSYGERMDGDGYGNCLVHPGADLRGNSDGGGIVHHCQR